MDRTAIIEQVLERAANFPASRAYFWAAKGADLPTEMTIETALAYG